jgi:aryl-alcohol dehydrogenase-like predicted oxidoreductase
MDNDKWSTEYAPYMEQLEALKKKGLIRAHGISSHSNAATEHAAKTPWTDVVHIRINPEGMSMDGPKDDAAARVAETVRTAKLCKDAGVGLIAMKVIGEGRMKDDPAMRKRSAEFVKKHVDVMIVGFEDIPQVEEFILNAV